MEPWFIAIYLLLLVILVKRRRRKKFAAHRIAAKKHLERKGERIMEKVAAKYLGKGVIINTINDTHVGFLQSYDDGWLTLVYKGKETEINCDYIIKIEAHPIPEDKKNAKK